MAGKAKSGRNQLVELVVIVAVALGLALGIQAFLVKPYRIPSGSMEPTLAVGQRVLVNRIGNNFGAPSIGDIVVFNPPSHADAEVCGADHDPGTLCPRSEDSRSKTAFIKRVVGLPGDRIQVRDGHVIRNGARAREPFAEPCPEPSRCTFRGQITVPRDHYLMMGDNRDDSNDGRFWGPVPRDWIIGGAFATYWPPTRIGLL